MTTRAWMSWSSGKDSTLALQSVGPGVEVTRLLVTVNENADRVAMHAVRRSLLEQQAERLGLPLHVVAIPSPCPNDVYEARMVEALDAATRDGVSAMVFGDLFLEDVRLYREHTLAPTGIVPVFPLWSRPTDEVAHQIVGAGIRAVLTCVDPAQLSPSFVGRPFDEELLDDLPASVDPCGERGEFHTFVWDAPEFSSPIPIRRGEKVTREGFVFCDVLPAEEPGNSTSVRP
jgi:uncharacterized protein (TIGR00290 family)